MLAKWGENIVIAGKRHQEIHVCVRIYKTREDGTKRTALSRGYLQKYHFGLIDNTRSSSDNSSKIIHTINIVLL